MVQMQISLPDTASEFIRQQVSGGRYRSADEYLAELVGQARAMAADEWLEKLIREGLESEGGEEITDEWWEQFGGVARRD